MKGGVDGGGINLNIKAAINLSLKVIFFMNFIISWSTNEVTTYYWDRYDPLNLSPEIAGHLATFETSTIIAFTVRSS